MTARKIVMKMLGWADLRPCGYVGHYICFFNPDACGLFEWIAFSPDISRALQFDEPEHAMRCWRQQSKVKPLRDDGYPNRPLTACTVLFEPTIPWSKP